MTDKGKVTKGIEQCFMSYVKEEYETQCWDCPYFNPDATVDQCRGELKEDILKLLKEQDEAIKALSAFARADGIDVEALLGRSVT